MTSSLKYNRIITGVIGGILLPVIAFLVFYHFTDQGLSVINYLKKTAQIGNLTQILSVCVFSNIIIFLVFNRFDMLNASKGVLGITIIWALAIFGIKLF